MGESESFQHGSEEYFVLLQEKWKGKGHGLCLKSAQDGKDCEKVTHFMFAQDCYLISSSRKELCEMTADATVELRRRTLEWK